MLQVLKYIIEVIICSALFLVCYRWMIARKVSFRICRIYIMTTMMLSVAIPAMNIPVYKAGTMETPVWMMADYAMVHQSEEASAAKESVAADTGIAGNAAPAIGAAQTAPGESTVNKAGTEKIGIFLRKHGNRIIGFIYLALVLASLSLTAYNCIRIRALRRRSKLTYTKEYTLAEHEDTTTPFSFLRTIFMGLYKQSYI